MPKLLTKRKQRWADQFKPDLLRGTALNPNIASADRYYQKLEKLVVQMSSEYTKAIEALFDTKHAKEYFAQDITIAAQAKILTNALTKKFDDLFAAVSKPLAEQMASEADKTSSASLHMSLKQLSGGLSLPTTTLQGPLMDVLNATVTENVGLIKSIASQYLDGVQGAVMRSITSGNGLQDLVPFLEKHEGITKRRARFIAYDQTRKAFNNLNKGRMQAVGLKEYEWLHSGGSKQPRHDHIEMSGNVYRFDDPPVIDKKTGERGIPGQLPGCRCRMVPVISFDED